MDYYDIVKKLIGPIIPVGESNEDERREQNLDETTQLVYYLLNDIKEVALQARRPEYSMSLAGKLAARFLDELQEGLNDED